jgi:hypothetical protein
MIGIGVNILGQLTRVRYPAALRAYWQRVRDDGGVMLSMNAATDAYRSAPDASLVWAASAYDTGTLYSVLPVGGTGDFTVARNSPAYTDNADGTLSEVAVNVPKFVYRNGKFYALPERAATNLLLNSLTLSTQDVTVTAQAYTLQFRGTGSVALSGAHTATLSGTGVNDRVTLTFTPSAGTLTLTITGSVTYAQLETGSYASSYILTEATTETRDADVITKTGASALIGQTAGSIIFTFDAGDDFDLYIDEVAAAGLSGMTKVQFDYTATTQTLYIDDVEVDSATGTYDWSDMDVIDLGNMAGEGQLNGGIANLILV